MDQPTQELQLANGSGIRERVTSGVHTVGFQIRAEYFSSGPGDVIVAPVSLVAVSLTRSLCALARARSVPLAA
jgi:hypothetical protein